MVSINGKYLRWAWRKQWCRSNGRLTWVVLASSMVSIKRQASLTGSGLIHAIDYKHSCLGFPGLISGVHQNLVYRGWTWPNP